MRIYGRVAGWGELAYLRNPGEAQNAWDFLASSLSISVWDVEQEISAYLAKADSCVHVASFRAIKLISVFLDGPRRVFYKREFELFVAALHQYTNEYDEDALELFLTERRHYIMSLSEARN